MNRVQASCAAVALLFAAGCATSGDRIERSQVVPLGDHFESSVGSLFVIGVQDEYRLIRCVPMNSGPIAGCYEDVFCIRRDDVQYNRWMGVDKVPGLELAIVSTTEVAFRVQGGHEAPR